MAKSTKSRKSGWKDRAKEAGDKAIQKHNIEKQNDLDKGDKTGAGTSDVSKSSEHYRKYDKGRYSTEKDQKSRKEGNKETSKAVRPNYVESPKMPDSPKADKFWSPKERKKKNSAK